MRPRWRRSWASARRCSTVGARTEREPNAPKASRKPGRTLEELEAENRRLRDENAKLLEQREILKKSLGILSEVPLRDMPGSNR